MDKLKIWDERAEKLSQTHPLKGLSHLPSMPGMTKQTARFLKFKSLKYLIKHDEPGIFKRYFFKRPLTYTFRLLKSWTKKKAYTRQDDLFLYGLSSVEEFEKLKNDPTTLLVVGFSYCHKPFECPSGRFTDQCIHNPEHPVCGQCFIGKCMSILPKNAIPLFIPTIHYIGEKIFEITEKNPDKKVLFLITACEMTLEMFGDWGNMVKAKGIGVRLDGRICNTMKAFELSEKGIKPGLTIVQPDTQTQMLNLINLTK